MIWVKSQLILSSRLTIEPVLAVCVLAGFPDFLVVPKRGCARRHVRCLLFVDTQSGVRSPGISGIAELPAHVDEGQIATQFGQSGLDSFASRIVCRCQFSQHGGIQQCVEGIQRESGRRLRSRCTDQNHPAGDESPQILLQPDSGRRRQAGHRCHCRVERGERRAQRVGSSDRVHGQRDRCTGDRPVAQLFEDADLSFFAGAFQSTLHVVVGEATVQCRDGTVVVCVIGKFQSRLGQRRRHTR